MASLFHEVAGSKNRTDIVIQGFSHTVLPENSHLNEGLTFGLSESNTDMSRTHWTYHNCAYTGIKM